MKKNRISNQWMKIETCNFASFSVPIFKWLGEKLNCWKSKLEFNSSNKSFHFIRFFYLSALQKLFTLFSILIFFFATTPLFTSETMLFMKVLSIQLDTRKCVVSYMAATCVSTKYEGVGGFVLLLCSRQDGRKKLYNYVSVYDSHFHYVPINMFRYTFRFLKTISHTTTRFRLVKGSIRYCWRQEARKIIKCSVVENVCELDSSFSFQQLSNLVGHENYSIFYEESVS